MTTDRADQLDLDEIFVLRTKEVSKHFGAVKGGRPAQHVHLPGMDYMHRRTKRIGEIEPHQSAERDAAP